MSAEELAILGIAVYFLQSNRYFDIRKSAIDGVIQKYTSFFNQYIIKHKIRYAKKILTLGVARYIDEHEEIKKLILQYTKRQRKQINWIDISEEIVKSFNSVISFGDISIYMHNLIVNYYKSNKQNKEQSRLYTFIDMYFGQNDLNCFEDIYKNFYHSLKRGVFVYANESYTIIDIVDRNNGNLKSID